MKKLLTRLNREMMRHDAGSPKRIQHFTKVHGFAKLIAECEGVDERTLFLIETAALVHDIGIRPALEKYGSSAGPYQEELGAVEADRLLKALGFDEAVTERVSYLVGHHHTYSNIDGIDYQILVEADYLVNLYEHDSDETAIRHALDTIFRTTAGREIAETMFFGTK